LTSTAMGIAWPSDAKTGYTPKLSRNEAAPNRCHPERSRGTSPTWVTRPAGARSLGYARDDIAMASISMRGQYVHAVPRIHRLVRGLSCGSARCPWRLRSTAATNFASFRVFRGRSNPF